MKATPLYYDNGKMFLGLTKQTCCIIMFLIF